MIAYVLGPHGGLGALCNLLAAGRGSKARQGEATQGARHCRVRQGARNTKTAKQGRARQQKTRRANAKQNKARQGRARQDKARRGSTKTKQKGGWERGQGEARQGEARQSTARQDNGKTRQGTAPCSRTLARAEQANQMWNELLRPHHPSIPLLKGRGHRRFFPRAFVLKRQLARRAWASAAPWQPRHGGRTRFLKPRDFARAGKGIAHA